LPEIIAEVLKVGPNSKAVDKEYQNLLQKLGSEFKILMDVPLKDIGYASSALMKEAIFRMREGNVHIAPGFDGEYGKIKIFEAVERKEIKGQSMLF
jgi:PHP family Zn ribbon phosphoesterase